MRQFDIFPTPIRHLSSVIDSILCKKLIRLVNEQDKELNSDDKNLLHTTINSMQNELIDSLVEKITPELANFGTDLLGENLPWLITGLWGNVMKQNGSQNRHNHCNSFISGVLFLNLPAGSYPTRFWRREMGEGGGTFYFNNDNKNKAPTIYNNDFVDLADVESTDLILFPSYVVHDVRMNRSTEDRITIAFNSVPSRVSLGAGSNDAYSLKFSL